MPTLTQLLSNLTEIVIYAAIALVTLTGLCKCIYPLLRNAALLNRAVIKLEKSTAAGERPIWREARFLGRSLRNEWQQFLLNAGQLDMRGIPCDTREYINEETVVEKPGHAQLAELIPGLLTSLGILGTFIGLMQGLTSVDFSNAEGTIQSIPQLLSGMRFAFATSVAGISCSLLFNMFNRMSAGRAVRALDNFEDAFYELGHAPPASARRAADVPEAGRGGAHGPPGRKCGQPRGGFAGNGHRPLHGAAHAVAGHLHQVRHT